MAKKGNSKTVSAILGIIGGILMLLGAIIKFVITTVFASTVLGSTLPILAGTTVGKLLTAWLYISLIFGVVLGLLVIILGAAMYLGKAGKIAAILMLILGILGFFGPMAGFVVGPILAIVGGALGLKD